MRTPDGGISQDCPQIPQITEIQILTAAIGAAQPDGQLHLGQTSFTPNLGQPPTKHSVQLIKLRLPVHHGLADMTILQIELQLIKPVRILTWSLVTSY